MPLLGLTGGIATGKTTFLETLLPLLGGAEVYDADQAVHRLLQGACKEPVVQRFGPEILDVDGQIDRSLLREKVIHSKTDRADLEAILHPAVRSEWREMARVFREKERISGLQSGDVGSGDQEPACNWLILAIPLLFEVGAESEVDVTVVVACKPETQLRRLIENRRLNAEAAKGFLSAQLPIAEKIARCDYLIWNDGARHLLHSQASLLTHRLKNHVRSSR